MKVILCGYNWTGCKALEILLENKCEVFVFSHESPFYVNDLISFCRKRGIGYSTQKISVANLPFKPDVICSIYYRYIISDELIDACNGRVFNLHPSLLPDYRGCSSLTWALIEGENYVGFTYHYLTKEIDSGDILLQEKIKVEDFDTQITLYYRVMFLSMEKFFSVVQMVFNKVQGKSQDLTKGRYFKRGAPFSGKIDSSWELVKVERFIRGMIFPPLPLATFNDHPIHSLDQYVSIKESK